MSSEDKNNKCFICKKPATHECDMLMDNATGSSLERQYLCDFHKKELSIYKRKNAGYQKF